MRNQWALPPDGRNWKQISQTSPSGCHSKPINCHQMPQDPDESGGFFRLLDLDVSHPALVLQLDRLDRHCASVRIEVG
jgi:hypothetical protein